MISTEGKSYGLNTPAYVAIDDLSVTVSEWAGLLPLLRG